MNNLLSNEFLNPASVLENVSSACRNYSHHLPQGDYVRHPSYPQTLVRPYAVTIKDTSSPGVFLGVWGSYFSSNGVIP